MIKEAQIVNKFLELEDVGCTTKEDVTHEVQASMVKKNKEALTTLRHTILNYMNPFNNIDSDFLFNISTGKAAIKKTEEFLLKILEVGDENRSKFIEECSNDITRFEKPIKKNAISTFANEGVKYSVRHKNSTQELKLERDLVSKILLLSLDNKIDLQLVLNYPLTPVPLSLCNLDGTIVKTNKAALLSILQSFDTDPEDPPFIDAIIVDGFFFLHLIKDHPTTFEALARFILSRLCALKGKEIHLVFDKIVTPSIKDIERDRRTATGFREDNFVIGGPHQKCPTNFIMALRQDNFKRALVAYLIEEWEKDFNFSIIGSKIIYVTHEDICYKFYEKHHSVIKEIAEEYCCEQEEADTKIIFHIEKSTSKNIIIRASDTDIAVIALAHVDLFNNKNKNIWIELGQISNNTLRYINISKIQSLLGATLCDALPAFHAFTGCDYDAAFYGKGKKRPFKLLQQCPNIQTAFANLGSKPFEELSGETLNVIEGYVCKLYGKPNIHEVNKARLDCFIKSYGNNSEKNPLLLKKSFNAQNFPPCKEVLLQKIRRSNQISAIWKNATKTKANFNDPVNNGWVLKDNKFEILWFEGPQTPKELGDILLQQKDLSANESDDDVLVESSDDEDDML